MNFIKRAWLATKAKKGRTALLILVTSAILIFVLAGLTIKNAADSAVESAKSEAGATVTLSVNREAMMKAFDPDSDSSSDDSVTIVQQLLLLTLRQPSLSLKRRRSFLSLYHNNDSNSW